VTGNLTVHADGSLWRTLPEGGPGAQAARWGKPRTRRRWAASVVAGGCGSELSYHFASTSSRRTSAPISPRSLYVPPLPPPKTGSLSIPRLPMGKAQGPL